VSTKSPLVPPIIVSELFEDKSGSPRNPPPIIEALAFPVAGSIPAVPRVTS